MTPEEKKIKLQLSMQLGQKLEQGMDALIRQGSVQDMQKFTRLVMDYFDKWRIEDRARRINSN
jgi:hypothetical protein